jgi:hypothetical protein
VRKTGRGETGDSMFDEIIETKIAPDGTVTKRRIESGEKWKDIPNKPLTPPPPGKGNHRPQPRKK